METVNLRIRQETRPETRAEQEPPRERRKPEVVFPHGSVRTRIWADDTPWGEVEFKVNQIRLIAGGERSRSSRSFRVEELTDVALGAIAAKRWIRKAHGRLRGWGRLRCWLAGLF